MIKMFEKTNENQRTEIGWFTRKWERDYNILFYSSKNTLKYLKLRERENCKLPEFKSLQKSMPFKECFNQIKIHSQANKA